MNFFVAKLLDIAAVLVLLVLFMLLATGGVIQSVEVLPWIGHSALLLRGMVSALSFALTVGVLSFVIWVFSPVRLRRSHLLGGAAVAALLLAVIRPLFGLFLRFNPDYGYAFGSLKAIFILVVWVYYTLAIVLLGAEIVATLRRRDALLLKGLLLDGARLSRAGSVLLRRFVRMAVEGETLFSEGDAGSEMFYLLSGDVDLSKNGHSLARMKAGDYFGEMSMLLNAPRSATARVVSAGAELVVIASANFDLIVRENPDVVHAMLTRMAGRLQATDERIHAPRAAGG